MKAIDVSQWQGDINWGAVNTDIALIKMSGGDAGLYYDSKASYNYAQAKSHGKAVGMYHFAGGGDPIAEADYFIKACSPLEANDVLILDWETRHATPVAWCATFIQRVIDRTKVIPIIYMNTSTENAYDWTPVINKNVGLWVADYRFTPSQNVPVTHWKSYIMHQYTSGGSVPGVAGRVDLDEWFGTVDAFKKYGFKVTTTPAPTTPTPTPAPKPTPTPVPTPTPTPPVISDKDKEQDAQIGAIKAIINSIINFFKSLTNLK